MTPETAAALRAHLISSGVSGDTATPRASAVSNAEKLAEGDPDKHLGTGARGRDVRAVLEAVAALCGCSSSIDEREGPGVIDPDRTLEGLVAAGDRLAGVAHPGARVLITTGHPTGLLPMYQAVGRALIAAGVTLEMPIENVRLETPRPYRRPRTIRYLDGVGCLCTAADVLHTHESWPMQALLGAIDRPDLVLADHGFAGAAAARGFDPVCFTDVNDPAIAVAKADGLIGAVVPLDDNLPPVLYEPLRDYLIGRIFGRIV